MKNDRASIAGRFFKCSERERAAFEAGIKLGTIYHQFIGTPISMKNVDLLEKTITEGTKIQPFVKNAEVHIEREKLRSKKGEFDYDSLSGEMLSVRLEIAYGGILLTARMENIPEIHYPLMYIDKISEQE